jgi:hypothetical protein
MRVLQIFFFILSITTYSQSESSISFNKEKMDSLFKTLNVKYAKSFSDNLGFYCKFAKRCSRSGIT